MFSEDSSSKGKKHIPTVKNELPNNDKNKLNNKQSQTTFQFSKLPNQQQPLVFSSISAPTGKMNSQPKTNNTEDVPNINVSISLTSISGDRGPFNSPLPSPRNDQNKYSSKLNQPSGVSNEDFLDDVLLLRKRMTQLQNKNSTNQNNKKTAGDENSLHKENLTTKDTTRLPSLVQFNHHKNSSEKFTQIYYHGAFSNILSQNKLPSIHYPNSKFRSYH